MKILGYEFGGSKNAAAKPVHTNKSFTPPEPDGAVETTVEMPNGSISGGYVDLDFVAKDEIQMINKYRKIAMQPEAETAIDDIVNDAIIYDEINPPVSINLDNVDSISKNIKTSIANEFKEVLRLLNFNKQGSNIFRKWYVDGRIYYHKIIDKNNPKKGLIEARFVDPRKINKVRELVQKKNQTTGVEEIISTNEYYVYKETQKNNKAKNQNHSKSDMVIRISPDAITYVHSGKIDADSELVIGHLHKAIKPFNQLRMIEDAIVIYRLARAPERRVFYIDVGNLPKQKAEQYLSGIMNKYRNRMVYDASTGDVKSDHRHLAMLEDFWLPRREGGKGTEIDTLAGGNNLDQIEDVQYFKKKLYRALNVPVSRLEAENGFNLGRSSEITRDEMKFSKFIVIVQEQFSQLFLDLLRTQLILKNIITEDDWDKIQDDINFIYLKNSYFEELKNMEVLNEKLDVLSKMDDYIGVFFDREYVQKNVLNFSDEEIARIDEGMKKDKKREAEFENDSDDNEGDNDDA